MKYILIVLAVLVGLFILYSLTAIISGWCVRKEEYTTNSRYYRCLLYIGTWIAVVFGRIKLHVRYDEPLPEGRFVVVGNHRSKFDPILTWWELRKRDVAFITKPENFSIIAFGRIIKKCCFLGIDREDPRKALTTIIKASELIKADTVSIGVYPEGTRSKDMNLLPFHNGVFKIAQKANVPIVVMTTNGTEMIHKNFPLKRSHVEMHFLKVLPAEEIKNMSTAQIGEIVSELMKQDLGH